MNRLALLLIGSGLFFLLCVESKTLDPYKVLGVERDASQREIQKAFHKLSLQYHPDKNKNKGAQEKFSEINNAYDILSDEQKRKNYDLYGDEKGTPGFDAGGQSGHFTSGGPGQSGFHFNPGGWENMGGGGQNGESSFSFSFGGPGSGKKSSFGFGFEEIFSNLFGGGGGNQFGGFGGSSRSQHGTRSSSKNVQSVSSKLFKKDIVNSGMTWLLLFHTSNNHQNTQYYESLVGEVAASLEGALKVGKIDCESDAALCKELGVNPRREPKVFVYSFISVEKGSLLEYDGDLDVKSLKSFCQENLPKLSKRINNLSKLSIKSEAGNLPKLLLLSTKKNTPVIWRVLSGLYRKRFAFYDSQVLDVTDSDVKKLGVDSLPAIVGWLSNGEKQVLKSGISVKDMKSAIKDLGNLLENFEAKNKKASAAKKDQFGSEETDIPLLAASNFDDICSNKVPVCLIGVFQSPKSREKLEKILRSVSQKSFSRRRNLASGSRDSVSYALVDATKHRSFLNSFDRNLMNSSDKILVAYKPKRGTYAASQGDEVTEEATERFITSILGGDVQFAKTRQTPSLK